MNTLLKVVEAALLLLFYLLSIMIGMVMLQAAIACMIYGWANPKIKKRIDEFF